MALSGLTKERLPSHIGPESEGRQFVLWSQAITALEYVRSKARRILAWTVVGIVISSILTFKFSKFDSTTQIMPPDNSGGLSQMISASAMKNPALAGLTGLAGNVLGIKSSGALFMAVMQSRQVQDNLISKFDLRKRWRLTYWEDARAKLSSRTFVTEDKKSGILSVTFRDRDPQFAQDMANAYVEELDRVISQVAVSAARRERMFIEHRLQDEKKALDEAQARFSQFSSKSMALDVPEQTKVTIEAAARLQGELITARGELEGLEQVYTPENVRVRTLRARVGELERQLTRINTGSPNQKGGDAVNPYPAIKNLPLVGVEWANLYRDQKIHETIFELLTQQYEVARIQEAREIPNVKVLDPAPLPEKKHPSPLFVVLVGTVLSAMLACLGTLLQYLWQAWDHDDPRRMMLLGLLRRRTRSA